MRHRLKQDYSTNAILAKATYMGLVAVVRIAKDRVSKKTRRYFKSIEKMWTNAYTEFNEQNRRKRDLAPIQNVESNMRGQSLKMVWISTKRYGNKETKRVYSWSEGTVEYLNSLLNYMGARLRDLAMVLFPFPPPQILEVREYADGTKKVLNNREIRKLGNDDAVKTYYRYGYERTRKSPRILLAHPTLPGLDFVDMIRAHCVELCRQCFIYDVPMLEAHRYIRLLIHNLKPFLEYVYTGGKLGRKNFNRDADKELRKVVLEIRSLYKKRETKRKRVSKRHEETLFPSIEFVKQKVIKQLKKADKPTTREALEKILDRIDTDDIVERDVEKLVDQVQALSGKEGTDWHRILFSDLHHPKSLKQVIFFGDKLLDDLSSIQIVAELPVAAHSGKVDLTVFIRREIEGQTIWTPVMVIEVKTKTGFDFNLFGQRQKRKRKTTVTPAFYAWKRSLTEEEWQRISTSNPDSSALNQLKEYEKEIITEYKKVVPYDPIPPDTLWKGVIVLDSDGEPSEVFSAFSHLLVELTTGLVHKITDLDAPLSVIPTTMNQETDSPRIALLVTPSVGPTRLLDELVDPTLFPDAEDPFIARESDDRSLTLYIPLSSPISSGNTAARLSTNWHLLHHLQECSDSSQEPIEILWLDLIGDFKSQALIAKRFGIEALHRERKITEETCIKLQTSISTIRFIDLHTQTDILLNEGIIGLELLIDRIKEILPEKKSKRIIVLDGWIELKEMFSQHRQGLLRSLEHRLLDAFPHSNVELIWIDSGTNHTKMNRYYQRKCVTPLRYDSPRRIHLDEIIYNVPAEPRMFGWLAPYLEDTRIIVQDVPADIEPWRVPIHVPHLIGFAKKFRGLSKSQQTFSLEEIEKFSEPKKMYGKGVTLSSMYAGISKHSKEYYTKSLDHALTLIPSAHRKVPRQPAKEMDRILSVVQTASSGHRMSLGARMQLDCTRSPPKHTRGGPQYTDMDQITRPWHYERAPNQFPEEENLYVSSGTPSSEAMQLKEVDTELVRERELRRVLNAARHLQGQSNVSDKLKGCCKRIETFCAKQFHLLKEYPDMRSPDLFLNALKNIQRIILEDSERAILWEKLRLLRENLYHVLNSEHQCALEDVLTQTPDLFLLYGNNLFLAVLAVLEGKHSLLEWLWNSIAEWTFYQIGLDLLDEKTRWVYSFRAILSGLQTRVKRLSQLELPETDLVSEQVGMLSWEEQENGYDALLLIPSKEGYVTALVDGLPERWIYPKWYLCVTTPKRLKDTATKSLSSMRQTPVIVTDVLDAQVFWIPVTDEYEELQWASFSVEYGRPSGRNNVVPWIRFTTTPPLSPPQQIPEVPDTITEKLRKLARIKHKEVPVKLLVTVDKNLGVFVVDIDGEDVAEKLEFAKARDLVRFLRYNLRSGTGYRLQGMFLIWGLDDIEFDAPVKFLKPLVHRSRFYPDEYFYPTTCREFLSTTIGNEIVMYIHPDDSKFRVSFEDLPKDSALRALETVSFDIYALGLLTECPELYDPRTRRWCPVTLDVRNIMDISFSKLHEYPRLQNALEYADVSEYDWTKDSWRFKGWVHRNEINWSIVSIKTGNTWMNRAFTYVIPKGQTPKDGLDRFRRAVASIVPPSRLGGFEDWLEGLGSTLRERGLEDSDERAIDRGLDEDMGSEDDAVEECIPREAVFEGIIFRSKYTSIRGSVVTVTLVSGNDEIEVAVVQDVERCKEDSRVIGGVDFDYIKEELESSLAGYELEAGELDDIKEEVRELLEQEGVVFFED